MHRDLLLIALLVMPVAQTEAQAPAQNYYLCSLYGQSELDAAFLIDYRGGKIYEVAHVAPTSQIKVLVYELRETTQYNVRGLLAGSFVGDYLEKQTYEAASGSSTRALLSLDRTQGFFLKLYTGVGDFYGPCRVSREEFSVVESKLREIGVRLRRGKK
jgi:hypothetical protein